MRPLLVDIEAVPEEACNDCLSDLFKAISEPPRGDAGIWDPHPNPFLTRHVEDVTQRLLGLLAEIRDAMEAFLTGRAGGLLRKAIDTPWMRWDSERFDEARRYLEAIPPGAWTLDDYGLLIDYLIQRYLPSGVIQREAEYLTVRAGMLGKIQAAMAGRSLAPGWEETLPELVPTSFRAVPPKVLSPIERAILEVANARAAGAISDVTEGARARMKRLVVEHVQARVLGQAEGTDAALQSRLFDEFADLNRDCRRIAVTEAGEAASQGYVAAQAAGTRLERLEAYRGACDWCRSINGRVFTVVAPDAPEKDGAKQVWVGKTNARRSASPRKREGGFLVEREAHERWWPAAGVQHPHCRGSWRVAADNPPPPGVNPAFADWLNAAIAATRPPKD